MLRFTAKINQNKALDGALFHIKLPAKQRRKQPQVGHDEPFREAELNSNRNTEKCALEDDRKGRPTLWARCSNVSLSGP